MSRILIGYSACPLTRQAFEQWGHDVWTCDLLPSRDDSSKHYQCDVWSVLGQDWDMAVLHPMCTYLTVSAAWAFKDGPYHQRVKAGTLTGQARRDARERELENFRRLLELPYPVCVENPAPSFINTAIRKPDQIIQPWMFGDDASKGTGLWLTHDLPLLESTGYVEPRYVNGLPRWANQTDSGQNKLGPREDRWLERSKTYPGIAAAMGDQWGKMFGSACLLRQQA